MAASPQGESGTARLAAGGQRAKAARQRVQVVSGLGEISPVLIGWWADDKTLLIRGYGMFLRG